MRVVFFTLILITQSIAFGAGSKGLLEDLRQLKSRESKRFFAIRKQLATVGTDNMDTLRAQFKEHKGRTDLLDRLIFYTDSHFKSGDEKKFLKAACIKLAEREVQNPEMIGNGYWEFFRNVSDVLADAKDSDLTAVAILESFMSYASVSKPKPAKGFLGSRDYTNGETYESANSVSHEVVGDLIALDGSPAKELITQPQADPEKIGRPQLKAVFISEQTFSKNSATESEKSQEKN